MQPQCTEADHRGKRTPPVDDRLLERGARIFRAMGDPARLRLLATLLEGPACAGDLIQSAGDTMAAISQRLRILRTEDIVRRMRMGKHVIYSLADEHTRSLILNGLSHAAELVHSPYPFSVSNQKENTMSEHITHPNHTHEHNDDCGHIAIKHDGHTDFLHDGHLHHPHEGHIDEHKLEVSATNPDNCTEGHQCEGHDAQHVHGADCGHEAVPHGDHVDYLVDGHLHHPHEGHCDNHGSVEVVQ